MATLSELQQKSSGDAADKEAYLRGLVDRVLRVTITDGRRMIGVLSCVDNYHNIILQHTRLQLSDDQAWDGKFANGCLRCVYG